MKKRHEIYKLALKRLKNKQKLQPYAVFGLCFLLSPTGYSSDINLNDFPELMLHKPKNMYSDCRWFDPEDADSRIDILKQCIKETKPCAPKTN